MRRRWRSVTCGLLLAVSCGGYGGSQAPPASGVAGSPTGVVPAKLTSLPGTMLPNYVVHATTLDAATISTDALDPSALASVLSAAGFEAGSERRFTTRGKAITEVVTRVLRFASLDGAASYVAWIRAHAPDVLGSQTQVAPPPDVSGAVAFSHAPCGSCAKDTFQYFAAWTVGQYAVTLRVGGPSAGPRAAEPIARALDARVRDDG